MKMFVESSDDPVIWRETLAAVGEHDFTHTFDFHLISQQRGEGRALAFIARSPDGAPLGVWPVLARQIVGADRIDFTSVYGYAGPVVKAGVDSSLVIPAMIGAMSDHGAVSVFSRMHPVLGERLDEKSRGEKLGDTVVIEIGTSEEVLAGYRGSHRREISAAHAKGVTLSREAGPEAVDAFYAIYHQAMSNLQAQDYYFFERSYLNALEAATDFETFILFANLNGQKIAASMFIVTGSIMQYYLSGTVAEFRRLAPSKVILAEAHRLGVRRGLKYLILGGGVGAGQDALLNFKKGFSSITLPFCVTRLVLDSDEYNSLCAERKISPRDTPFFPAYRATP